MGIARRKNVDHGTKIAPKKKKAKKEKPKHLNRKLESAATEDERRQILTKIRELEAAKQTAAKTTAGPTTLTTTDSSLSETGKSVTSDPTFTGEKLATTVSDEAGMTTLALLDKAATAIPTTTHPNEHVAKAQGKERETIKDAANENSESKDAAASDGVPQTSGGDNDEDPDSTTLKRQRGKRRRGRQDTSRVVEEQQSEEKEEATKTDQLVDDNAPVEKAKRYCLGRKPVTDFEVGKSYPGKIVYVKPSLGVFIDIGCHSDAFCHVSRLADDFVPDVEQWRNERGSEGDIVPAARVVEIDRTRKRITVSLQSAARAGDEMISIQARQERRRKLHQKRHGKSKSTSTTSLASSRPGSRSASLEPQHENGSLLGAAEQRAVRHSHKKSSPSENQTRPLNNSTSLVPPANINAKPLDAKAKAVEEKRQRKLARRAARRASQETGGEPSVGN